MTTNEEEGFADFSEWQKELLVGMTTFSSSHLRKIDFSSDQLAELGHLGVHESAINEIRSVLGACASLANKRHPARQDVHDKLSELIQSVTATSVLLTPLDHSVEAGRTPAQTEAMTRILVAEFDQGGDGDLIGNTAKQLHQLALILLKARDDLPAAKRQQGVHQWIAVGMIHLAMVRGFTGTEDPAADIGKLNPSSGISSPFRRAVGICFDAANDASGSDPEWAIKQYMKHLKSHRG